MRLAFFCSGFSPSNLRLQPWLTLLEVGRRLAAKGHAVTLATDASQGQEALPLAVQTFPSLRGTHSAQIIRWLEGSRPDRVVASITPFSLVTAGWHRYLGREKAWGYLAYALYTGGEFRGAWQHLGRGDRWGFGRNLFVPGRFWRRQLRQRFAGVICQSQRTASRLGSQVSLSSIIHRPSSFCGYAPVIPPGVDLDTWQPARGSDGKFTYDTFVYLGSPRPIRGYTVLLDAMMRLPAHLKLRVLARGVDGAGERELRRNLETRGLADRVTLIGGWLTVEQLRTEIQSTLAVVAPFVLVPSEVPVSVLEAIACGTPVIVTDIDGLPESVGDAGVVVPQAEAPRLAAAMLELASQPEKVASLRRACLCRRVTFQDWDAVAGRWAAVLGL